MNSLCDGDYEWLEMKVICCHTSYGLLAFGLIIKDMLECVQHCLWHKEKQSFMKAEDEAL